MRSKAQMRPSGPGSASSNRRVRALPAHMLYPPTITPPNSFSYASEQPSSDPQQEQGSVQQSGYPSLQPPAPPPPPPPPTAPATPHDWALRQSWALPMKHLAPPLPAVPSVPQQQLEHPLSSNAQPASVGLHPVRASDAVRYPIIGHQPHGSLNEAAASSASSNATAAAAGLSPQQAQLVRQSAFGISSRELDSAAVHDLGNWLQRCAQPAPVLLPQDAFESGELLPGAFSPLETALLHRQAALTQVSVNSMHGDCSPLLITLCRRFPCNGTMILVCCSC